MASQALEGKVVAITGSGRGLGAAYARLAADHGARVAVNDIDADEAEAVAREIVGAGGCAVAIPGDIASWRGANALIDQCVDAFGTIDSLCNNAAVFDLTTPFDQDPEAAARMIEVNLTGPIYVGMAAARAMKSHGRGGTIVNTTSGAQSGLKDQAVYGATKGGIAALTYGWAIDFADAGIRVNAVSPRAATRLAHRVHPDTNKGLTAEMAAPTAVFLMSELSHAFNGQVLFTAGDEIGIYSHPGIVVPSVRQAAWTVEAIAQAASGQLGALLQPLGRSRQRIEIVEEMSAAMD